MDSAPRQDLVILVADISMESAVSGLLSRPDALHIRPVASTIYVHTDGTLAVDFVDTISCVLPCTSSSTLS